MYGSPWPLCRRDTHRGHMTAHPESHERHRRPLVDDLRHCFCVRERRDIDLVLGRGILSARWDGTFHKLNVPGKFLISATEMLDSLCACTRLQAFS